MFKRLITLGLPRDKNFKLGLLLASLEALFALALLGVSAWLISAAAEQPPIMYLNEAIVGVRGFALGRAFFRYTQRLALHDSAFKMLSALRPRVFRKVAPLAPAGLAGFGRSDFANSLVNDVDEVQNLSLRVLTPLLQSAVVSIAAVVGLSLLAPSSQAFWKLSLVLVATAVIALPVSGFLNRKNSERILRSRAELSSATNNLLQNLELLQAYGWEKEALSGVRSAEKSMLASADRTALTTGIGTSLFSLFSTLAVFITAYQGAATVAQGGLDHRLLAVLALLPMAVYEISTGSLTAVISWQRYKAGATRLLTTEDQVVADSLTWGSGSTELTSIESISLVNAAFKYPDGNYPVVTPPNLLVSRGETLLITGPSGAGKTTVGFGLSGFLTPIQGEVLINGLPIHSYSESSVRTRIGYLEQSPTIFDGTLRINLLIGKQDATDEDIWGVLARVGLKSTFEKRDGLDTQMGERGLAVSGGEAQRIALARALLAGFQALVFDEPTANLDAETAEDLARDILTALTDGQIGIAIFISHDPIFEPLATVSLRL